MKENKVYRYAYYKNYIVFVYRSYMKIGTSNKVENQSPIKYKTMNEVKRAIDMAVRMGDKK